MVRWLCCSKEPEVAVPFAQTSSSCSLGSGYAKRRETIHERRADLDIRDLPIQVTRGKGADRKVWERLINGIGCVGLAAWSLLPQQDELFVPGYRDFRPAEGRFIGFRADSYSCHQLALHQEQVAEGEQREELGPIFLAIPR